MIDIEGVQLIIAEDVEDSQAAAGQHVIKIMKGEPGYSFGIFQWLLQLPVLYLYPLVEMSPIGPSGDIVCYAVNYVF